MQKLFRYLVLVFILIFVLSSNHAQCRSALPQRAEDSKKSLEFIDDISICNIRKTLLCNFLRTINYDDLDEKKEDQELFKRGTSQFFSNW
ncbi:unnamed protein product [Rotaria magnacalcarata]|uniref:Uncharacterized protein n=1 Tax=Rotaria magnacalcarata TaxID=392030 RepID=A0A814ICQ3_9BILA|nr:unnamed protein product [Rotaria magnacalcarata]CAF1598528.1 unnamed protein product [Rotaria magnacalcarata]CAF1960148.1 unnamed protein product [Rotaria magnacalcarata]CAF2105862.1 unnamed protein product [Rotaria magnacalcarata]CAF2109097.1 unnamed protein product [Rotaria magnacalcarata]